MASKKALAHRFLNISKISDQIFKNSNIFRSRFASHPNEANTAPEPGDDVILRRFHHRTASFQPPTTTELSPLPFGFGNLKKQLPSIGISRDRIRLDSLSPPPAEAKPGAVNVAGITVEDAKKLVRLAEMEKLKTKLKKISKNWITYEDFVDICGEDCSNRDHGLQLAKLLDESGAVIVIGKVVFLQPEQITTAIAGLISMPKTINEEQRSYNKELVEMEKEKKIIDGEAANLVRRELWWGLGFLMAQTLTFMRLTFWELSWDVMEPICFYVTSTYFMAGYAFFLTTSKEPSFEGFYNSRFLSKQTRLMKLYNFDVQKYDQLLLRRASDQQDDDISHFFKSKGKF